MVNLLDNPNDVGMLSLGLRLLSTPGKFGQALGTAGLGAMGDMQGAKQAQAVARQRMQQEEMQRMQIEQIKRQQAEQDKQRAAVDRFKQTLPAPGAAGDGMGPPQPNVDPRLSTMYGAMQAGLVSPMDYVNMIGPKSVKVKEYREIRMPDGSVRVVGLGEDGQVVDTGQTPFKLMERQNMGGFLGGIDPITGKLTNLGAMTQSPDSAASIAVQMRGQNMTDARARQAAAVEASSARANFGKPPAGYRFKDDGNLEAIPGGPADTKVGGIGAKVQDAAEAIALLNQADPLLKGSTGSYGGAAIDKLAQVFGASTPGSVNAQQLKAIEGALVAKMPKMTGPQSDKDVLLYRQMAAVIGDETVPYARKAAAVDAVREIQERYAGMARGSSKPMPVPTAAGPFTDAAKERRYQEWKRQQEQ